MKTKHMSIFAVADNDAGFVQAVISATDFPSFSAMGFVDAVNKLASEPAPIATAPVPEPTRSRKTREE